MSDYSLIGKVIGDRYRIDDLLGQGGMSTVYKAFDPNLKRVVAVKVIHLHLAGDQKFLMRFGLKSRSVSLRSLCKIPITVPDVSCHC